MFEWIFFLMFIGWICWIITISVQNHMKRLQQAIDIQKEAIEKWNGNIGCAICNKDRSKFSRMF